jgi:hypothetical protein
MGLHVGLVCFLCRDQAPRTTVTATIGTPPCSALREYGLAFTPSSTGTGTLIPTTDLFSVTLLVNVNCKL